MNLPPVSVTDGRTSACVILQQGTSSSTGSQPSANFQTADSKLARSSRPSEQNLRNEDTSQNRRPSSPSSVRGGQDRLKVAENVYDGKVGIPNFALHANRFLLSTTCWCVVQSSTMLGVVIEPIIISIPFECIFSSWFPPALEQNCSENLRSKSRFENRSRFRRMTGVTFIRSSVLQLIVF